MRWKGLIFLAVLIGIVVALGLLLTDKWLEKRLESVGTAIVGAKVEIDRLDFSIFGLHMRWDSLQVTNPKNTMKNMLTTGRTNFDLEFAPLLKKKVIIDNIEMTNVTSGTERTTDGKVEKKVRKKERKPNFITKTIDRLEADVAAAPAWQLDDLSKKVNVDSILKFLNITSPQKIDSLQKNLAITYNYWDSTFAVVDWENDLTYFKSRVTAINPGQLQTLDGLQSAYTTLNQIDDKVDSLETFVTDARSKLTTDLNETKTRIGQVDDWIKNDYKNALAQAKLPTINKENIAQFIFGAKVVAQATQILGTVNTVRDYAEKFKSDKPKKEKPPRLKGQTIYFTRQQSLPNFWIKNINLSGHTTRGLQIGGELKHLVSNQTLIGEPTTFDIKGERGDGANLNFYGEFNYLGESPVEKFALNMGAMPLNNVKLSDSPLLPNKIEKGLGDLKASLHVGGESLNSEVSFVANKLNFDFGENPSEKLVDKTVRKILSSASTVDLDVSLKSSDERTVLGLDSNLDELFARELQKIVGEELQAARDKIEAEVQKQVTKYKNEFDTYVARQTESLEAQMKKYEDLLNEQKALIETKKKELEARIEEEKQKAQKGIEEEAKKRLKGLFE
ncbi:TIGR03545 family protein [candidate division KSB1 bacterium]|nr:TIGR03545 family protein [candidate division KSB1 bacterium]